MVDDGKVDTGRDREPDRRRIRPEWDVLLVACRNGDARKVEELVLGNNKDSSYNNNNNVLIPAYHSNSIGQSAIHIAAWWGWTDVLEVLLKSLRQQQQQQQHQDDDGNNDDEHEDHKDIKYWVNAQNTIAGSTPLHCVVQSVKSQGRRVDAARVLLNAGALVSTIQDYNGITPLEFVLLDNSSKYIGSDEERMELIELFQQYDQQQQKQQQQQPADKFQKMLLEPTTSIEDIEKEFANELLPTTTITTTTSVGGVVLSGNDTAGNSSYNSYNYDDNNTHILLAYSPRRQDGNGNGGNGEGSDTPLLALVRGWIQDHNLHRSRGCSSSSNNSDNSHFYSNRIEWLLKKITAVVSSSNDSAGADNDAGDGRSGGWKFSEMVVIDLPHRSLSSSQAKRINNMEEQQHPYNALDLLCQGIFTLYQQELACSNESTATAADNITTSSSTFQQWSKLALKLVYEFDSKPCCSDTTHRIWFEICRRNYKDLASLWWGTPPRNSTRCHSLSQNLDRHLNISPLQVCNRQNMSPLHFAARSGHLEMVQWLLDTEQSWSTLLKSLSSTSSSSTQQPVSSWLLNHKDCRGKTPLDAAEANGRDDVVQFLLERQGPAKQEETAG